MKRLLLIIAVIILAIIAYFEYQAYTRFNPPNDYSYVINDSIDTNYFNPLLLQQYYENVYELSAFARAKWANEGIDVLFPEENNTSKAAAKHYNNLLAMTAKLEDKLIFSASLKKQGYDNTDIQQIIEKGLSLKTFDLMQKSNLIGLRIGDESQSVWDMQKIFIQMGYDIPKDGKFGIETESALKDFQTKNDLYASGVLDNTTLRILLKNI